VEIFGNLNAGDEIITNASEDIRDGELINQLESFHPVFFFFLAIHRESYNAKTILRILHD
jgi:hypothetical protein